MNSGISFNTTLVKVSELENSPDPSLPVWLLLPDRPSSKSGRLVVHRLGESEASDAHQNRHRPAALRRDALLSAIAYQRKLVAVDHVPAKAEHGY